MENVRPYIAFLEDFIKAHDVKSIVDADCGDWTFSRCVNFGDVHYKGYDVVKDVIERNQRLFSNSSVKFVHGDFLQLDLPQADLLICKDVLQHLSNEEVFSFLWQIKKYFHCLITNDVDNDSLTSDNLTINHGEYRNIDLTQPPFNVDGSKVLTFQSEFVTKQVLYIQNP